MLERLSSPTRKEPSPAELRERIFTDKIITRLIGHFTESLEEVDYSPQVIQEIKKELMQYSEEDIKGAIAIPTENSERYLSALKHKSPKELVETLVSNAKKHGFTIGYHVSSSEITNGHIEGKEPDHRDSDLPRAYYSTRYKDLYFNKHGKYLYVIRAETGENSTHRQDNDGSWGRASTLAVIDRLNLKDIEQEVEFAAKKYTPEKNKTT